MAAGFSIYICCTLLFLTTIQAVGFLSPNWVTDSEGCQIRGLFYQCCPTNGTGSNSTAGKYIQCKFQNFDASLSYLVFVLELAGCMVLLVSFITSLIACCSRDGKDACSCTYCCVIIFYVAGTMLTFSGCMVLVSLGYTSFGYSFWLSLTPGSVSFIALLLLICTICCNACCGDDNDLDARHSLSTIVKFRMPGRSTERLLYRD